MQRRVGKTKTRRSPADATREMRLQMGTLEVITGPMFSSKSTTLVRRIQEHAGSVYAIKHIADDRYLAAGENPAAAATTISTHDNVHIKCVASPRLAVLQVPPEATLIAIDEVQMFDVHDAVAFCREQMARGRNVVAAGLDTNWKRVAYPTTTALVDLATSVDRRTAICGLKDCCLPARFTARTVASKDDILVGGSESYIASCLLHHRWLAFDSLNGSTSLVSASPLRVRPPVAAVQSPAVSK